MRINMSASGFNKEISKMQSANATVQGGFAQMMNKNSDDTLQKPTSQDDTNFVNAFVEEKVASRSAEMQLEILKTQDQMLGTIIDIKKD